MSKPRGTAAQLGVYIGGANRACSQPNLNAAWISHNQAAPHVWGIMPIWVGPQMPNPSCQTTAVYNSYISLNTTTAYTQGWNEAAAALAAAGSSGLGMDLTGMPIAVDIEGYVANSGCRAAAQAYVDGWDAYLQRPPAQKAGVYGSQCATFLTDFTTIAHVPDFVWFAYLE